LTGDLRVSGIDTLHEPWRFDLADSPDRGFDFTDDTTEHTADNSAEHAADNSAFDTTLDTAFDADIGEFFFGDFIGDFDGSDELTWLDGRFGLNGFDTCSGTGFAASFSWRRWRGRRRRRRCEKRAVDFHFRHFAFLNKRKND
jgi:hypothetical protein